MNRAVPFILAASLLAVAAPSGAVTGRTVFPAARPTGHLRPAVSSRGPYGDSPAARAKLARGYLPRDAAAYDRAKALLGTGRGRPLPPARPATPIPSKPVASPSWKGVSDTTVTPSDSTGAVGTSRYVELINLKFGIYDRTGAVLSTGSLGSLTADLGGLLTDPQVIWDPDTSRFYYSVLDFSSNELDVGFSKTASPSSSGDWCKYFADYQYGALLPDYPKLGDTEDFWLIGVNVFDGDTFLRADVNWITKPGPGSTCPSGLSFQIGQQPDLRNTDDTLASTPVPVNQTDGSELGWVVASRDTTLGDGADLSLFSVTTNLDGSANIQPTGDSVPVETYSLPPSAPQPGTAAVFDTLDGRLTQAVSAVDPFHSSLDAIWTQHTVAGGAGTEVRWYEVDPSTLSLIQDGSVTHPTLYAFNGAISPDRVVKGSTTAFGDSMVLGFDTSSSSTYEAIRMVSKIGGFPQSVFVLVKQSPGRNEDFACTPVCRWGDYAGASPDPGASTSGSHGKVWLTSAWNKASKDPSNVDWRTQNWGATP